MIRIHTHAHAIHAQGKSNIFFLMKMNGLSRCFFYILCEKNSTRNTFNECAVCTRLARDITSRLKHRGQYLKIEECSRYHFMAYGNLKLSISSCIIIIHISIDTGMRSRVFVHINPTNGIGYNHNVHHFLLSAINLAALIYDHFVAKCSSCNHTSLGNSDCTHIVWQAARLSHTLNYFQPFYYYYGHLSCDGW